MLQPVQQLLLLFPTCASPPSGFYLFTVLEAGPTTCTAQALLSSRVKVLADW